MAESDLHLKLDRILAILSVQQQALSDHDQSIMTLTAAMHSLSDDQATMRELLERLAEAMSQEQDGSEMRDLITRIEAHMAQMVANGSKIAEAFNALPQAMADATTDGVRLAMNSTQ